MTHIRNSRNGERRFEVCIAIMDISKCCTQVRYWDVMRGKRLLGTQHRGTWAVGDSNTHVL